MTRQEKEASQATETQWHDLANAIILHAVARYRALQERLRSGNHIPTGRYSELANLERFFVSQYFATLTDIDGLELLARLQDETVFVKTKLNTLTAKEAERARYDF